MVARTVISVCLLVVVGMALAQDKPKKALEAEAKDVSGMSIVGTNETPKSLIIIPWKSSEIGQEGDFKSSLLNLEIAPVDKPTFLRELEFYRLSNPDASATE